MNVIGILSYNMPHLTDSIVMQIKQLVKAPYKLIVLDNGSDTDKISQYTTHFSKENTMLTGGMNQILDTAKLYNPDYIWLCTNDIKLEYNIDPFETIIEKFKNNKDAGIIHPSLIKPVENYFYDYMIKIPGKEKETGIKKVTMVDFIAPCFKKESLDTINWRFDERFKYGWGIDYEIVYETKKAGMNVYVDFDLLLSHQTSAVYDSGNSCEFKNRQEYYKKAGENMNQVMIEKYGCNWSDLILNFK